MKKLIRVLDILLSVLGLLFAAPVMLILMIIGYFDTGSPLFFQKRVGRYKKEFCLVKFRTMKRDTASVASHLVDHSVITKFGRFLRKSKLDELPQLWNVLKGEMSLVGPRPGLSNQVELLEKRDEFGVFEVRPGITGLAQVSDIDMSTPGLLAKTDSVMVRKLGIKLYFQLILQTAIGKGLGDRVRRP